ncbi:MAG: hypothetical protein ABEH35_04980, partial [Haloarculaceae archaeon]
MKHAIDAIGSRTGGTPEMVIRRLPVAVISGADESPPVGTVFDLNSRLLRHSRSGVTGGGIKAEIHVRVVKVKVNSS